jgi:hypothetical protein
MCEPGVKNYPLSRENNGLFLQFKNQQVSRSGVEFVQLGKHPLHFVAPQVKINAEYYLKQVLEGVLLPWSKKNFKNQSWTFQQDSAPAHKVNSTIEFCKNHFPDVITPEEWSASSNVLKPIDYSI